MYLDNKYTTTYYSIIQKAQARKLQSRKEAQSILGYVERHHIVPRSLGGNNAKANLVYLTAREHFVCHLLLLKMTTGADYASMVFAIQNFKNRKKDKHSEYKITNRTYAMIRGLVSENMSNLHKGRMPWNKGIPQSEASNKKRSLALKGRIHSEAHRRKNAEARLGTKREYSTEGIKNIIAAANLRKGIPLLAEAIKNRYGNVWWNDGVIETRAKTKPGDNFTRGRLKKIFIDTQVCPYCMGS